MRIFRDPASCPPGLQGGVVALGNFDGMHLGHQAVLRAALEEARTRRVPCLVLTFHPHPRRFFQPHQPPLALMSLYEKAVFLRDLGVEGMAVLRFNEALSRMSAADFVRGPLLEQIRAVHLVTGEDFVFGHRRGGTAALLANWGKEMGFGVTAAPPVLVDGQPCSSTRIRDALKAGDCAQAAHLLGRAYAVTGRVCHGDKRGRVLGFPTANLSLARRFYPQKGVYAVRVELLSERAAAATVEAEYRGVANLGLRPSFSGERPMLEAHIFDAAPDLYGRRIRVTPLHFLRPERAFEGIDALKRQIALDAAQARVIVSQV